MLTHIQVLCGQGLCRLTDGHLFKFLLMTPSACCGFPATGLHCAVQFNAFNMCMPRLIG